VEALPVYTANPVQLKSYEVTGAGAYHPATSTASFVEPIGLGITNTISRAELAAITAAILHGHLQIATFKLPLAASRLSIKPGSTCCTLSCTAAMYKGIS